MTNRDLPTLTATAMPESSPAFTHYPDNYPYSIKRHGLTLVNCDSEPVRGEPARPLRQGAAAGPGRRRRSDLGGLRGELPAHLARPAA